MTGQAIEREFFMRSNRLGFGIWRHEDANLAAAIWGDPEVTKLTGGPFTPQQVQDRLAIEIQNQRNLGIQYWPLFRLDTGRLVGCCGLRLRDEDANIFELGFQLCRDAWGQGFAIEAAGEVIAWAADKGIAALIAGHHPENGASSRTLQRLGFRYTHDELYAPTGQMEPCYILKIAERSVTPEQERDALAALIERMLHAEARTDAPPESEHGDWLYGGVGPVTFTEPDAHGWLAPVLSTARAWTPKALVFWHEVVRTGLSVSPTLAAHPAHSLARWPAIERAVQVYVAASTGE